MNNIRIISAADLTEDLIRQWKEIVAADRYLHSPFLQPEFTVAVAQVRRDVEIALIENDGQVQGLFPFQRGPGGLMRNVGSRLSEFHTPIVRAGVTPDMPELLRVGSLSWWHFDHLPIAESALQGHVWGTTNSPFIDLSNGYESYVANRKASGSSMTNALRKMRKMEREVGPLRFEYHSTSEQALQSLLRWKDEQHRRTGRLRVLQYDWLVQLLRNLKNNETTDGIGLFSVLYAGENLVAVHLGLRSQAVIHLWFPAYDPEFEEYSPGLCLLLKLAEYGANCGIARMDLGRGEERYKANFKSGDILIGEGAVDLRPISGPLRKQWYHTKRTLRNSRWKKQFAWPMEVTRRLRQKLAFD